MVDCEKNGVRSGKAVVWPVNAGDKKYRLQCSKRLQYHPGYRGDVREDTLARKVYQMAPSQTVCKTNQQQPVSHYICNCMKTATPKNRRTCPEGHVYFKSSDCPVCPVCEQNKVPEADFMAAISAPARRALEHAEIKTLKQLAARSEAELSAMHGMGPKVIGILKNILQANKLQFRK